MSGTRERLVALTLDEETIGRSLPDVEHERAVAIYDLLEANRFSVPGWEGPYELHLSIRGRSLIFHIHCTGTRHRITHMLSLTPFRRVVRDYFLLCESYFHMIRTASPSRIEAVDMGRRAIHDEGSRLLRERLDGKLDLDFDTARRLFTLICVLYWRGRS